MSGGTQWNSGRLVGVARWTVSAAVGALIVCAAFPQPVRAQFSFFGQSEASPQDVHNTINAHGFRLVGPLVRNGDVYVADVMDRRQRRERLIITRSDGQIVQRFFVDLRGRPNGPGEAPPPQAPQRSEPDFFSRLVRGFGDDGAPPPRPPAAIGGDDAVSPSILPRQQRLTRPRSNDIEPRVATRREDAPIVAKPLPAPAPESSVAAPKQAAEPQAVPAATPTMPNPSPPPTRATVVSTDPLRIPGQRPPEPAAAPTKPVATKSAPKPDVPVAPLD